VKLTIVGCSGSVISPDAACSCYLVEERGFRLLLEIGTGAAGPLQRHIDPALVDHLVVSHAHADHCGDTQSLAYLRGRAGAPPLPIHGPSNLHDSVSWIRTEPEVATFTAITGDPVQAGPLTLRFARVRHGSVECWATRVDDALCFTADTEPCDALDELAQGCGTLLAQASGFERDDLPGHLSAAEAGRLARRSGAKLLVLTHMRAWMDQRELLDEAAREAGCPVVAAAPGVRTSL
jgi:ribonuclease BN (tRNA processing enzyme)